MLDEFGFAANTKHHKRGQLLPPRAEQRQQVAVQAQNQQKKLDKNRIQLHIFDTVRRRFNEKQQIDSNNIK